MFRQIGVKQVFNPDRVALIVDHIYPASSEKARDNVWIMRGGTSKGIYLKANDLPDDPQKRDDLILEIFGSPDVRQINGLAGADPLTSKLAIIGPPTRPEADVDYTFAQVSIKERVVDYNGNCGNISSGVGPFAIDESMVRAVSPMEPFFQRTASVESLVKQEVRDAEKQQIQQTLKKAGEASKKLAAGAGNVLSTFGDAVVGGSSQAVGSPTNCARIAHELMGEGEKVRKITVELYPELFARRTINIPGVLMGAVYGASTADYEMYEKSVDMVKADGIEVEIVEGHGNPSGIGQRDIPSHHPAVGRRNRRRLYQRTGRTEPDPRDRKFRDGVCPPLCAGGCLRHSYCKLLLCLLPAGADLSGRRAGSGKRYRRAARGPGCGGIGGDRDSTGTGTDPGRSPKTAGPRQSDLCGGGYPNPSALGPGTALLNGRCGRSSQVEELKNKEKTKMKVGFIGLGRMGKHMAANVVKNGFDTYVNDLVPALVDQLVALGAKHCPTNQALAAEVDVAFTMKRKGTGVGCMFYGVGNTGLPNPAAAFVEVLSDTSVNVTVGAADIGQGSSTVAASIAAETLGLDYENIHGNRQFCQGL